MMIPFRQNWSIWGRKDKSIAQIKDFSNVKYGKYDGVFLLLILERLSICWLPYRSSRINGTISRSFYSFVYCARDRILPHKSATLASSDVSGSWYTWSFSDYISSYISSSTTKIWSRFGTGLMRKTISRRKWITGFHCVPINWSNNSYTNNN